MKILNLYACLGGNRYKWDEVSNNIEVTAVELDPELARLYQERFPNDTVAVTDAHQYLLDHYREFDFIWSSPPCPTHSRARFWSAKGSKSVKPKYPDMKLYQEVLFLDNYFEGKYCVENVIPYYTPLIPAKKRGRHLYWTNFNLPSNIRERKIQVGAGLDEVNRLSVFHDFDFYKYKGSQRRRKIARNLVDYEAGKTILETAFGIFKQNNTQQTSLFKIA
jgi:DNA (cytosine-5)-methyltransferase 1